MFHDMPDQETILNDYIQCAREAMGNYKTKTTQLIESVAEYREQRRLADDVVGMTAALYGVPGGFLFKDLENRIREGIKNISHCFDALPVTNQRYCTVEDAAERAAGWIMDNRLGAAEQEIDDYFYHQLCETEEIGLCWREEDPSCP